jgi:hypothetical protein
LVFFSFGRGWRGRGMMIKRIENHAYLQEGINHHDLSRYLGMFLSGLQLHCAVVVDHLSQQPLEIGPLVQNPKRENKKKKKVHSFQPEYIISGVNKRPKALQTTIALT